MSIQHILATRWFRRNQERLERDFIAQQLHLLGLPFEAYVLEEYFEYRVARSAALRHADQLNS